MAKSKKKHKNSNQAVKQRELENMIADQKDRARKRMNPVARNILLGDLVYLSVIQLLDSNSMLTEITANVATLIGALLIPVALYFQFVNGNHPRLK